MKTPTSALAAAMQLALIMLAANLQLVVLAQNCGPAANGNKCGNNNCCSQFGYCGTGDSYCGGGCQKDYGNCNGCFPGNAWVLMRGGVEKPISELSIGDEVAVSIGKDGELQYDEVYANGHTDAAALSEFIAITMSNGGNTTKRLQLTPDHFVPVLRSQYQGAGNVEYKRAKDVIVGDVMMAFHKYNTEQQQQEIHFLVTGLETELLRGLFNPFTIRGTILVNNVVASCHSHWFLDSVFDHMGLSHLLPTTYQRVLAPVRMIYKKMGSSTYKSLYNDLDSRYNIAKSGSQFGGYVNLLGQVFLSKSSKGGKGFL